MAPLLLTENGFAIGTYIFADFVSGRIGAILPADSDNNSEDRPWSWRWIGLQDIQPLHVFQTAEGGIGMLTWQGEWYELNTAPLAVAALTLPGSISR